LCNVHETDDSVIEAATAPTDLAALVRALNSDELLANLQTAEPLALAGHDEWMKTVFFVTSNLRLGDQTPVDALKAGRLQDVLDAAQMYREQGFA
jgi:hypothetical protein